MKAVLYCPRCGSDRLAETGVSAFRRYRCEGCGRRLRDTWPLIAFFVVMAVVLAYAAAAATSLARPGTEPDHVAAGGLGVVCLVSVGSVVVALSRPTPRTARPVHLLPAGDWYVARHAAKAGPFGFDQMRQMAASGVLAPADMVLDAGTGQWASACRVAGLFSSAEPPTSGSSPAAKSRAVRWVALGVFLIVVVGLVLAVRGDGTGDGRHSPAPQGALASRRPATPAEPDDVALLSVGPGRAIHHPAQLRLDAERLAEAMREVGYAEGNWPERVLLARPGDVWVVELGLKRNAFDNPRMAAAMEWWVAVRIAAIAFPGARVVVRLSDPDGRERAVFRVAGAGRSPFGPTAAVYSLDGAKADGDRLADLLKRTGLDPRVAWVILLARRPDGWVVTPLNLRPAELTPAVRQRWGGLARTATTLLGASVRVEVLDDEYRPAASVSAADAANQGGP